MPLLSIQDLSVRFGAVAAVDGVSLEIRKGETLGLVGESGCGKTTLGRAILRLNKPASGSISFEGGDQSRIQMIFQDPYSSLNPRMRIGNIIGEPLRAMKLASGKEAEARVETLMNQVGLDPRLRNSFPGQFSGGMRQRVGIARALAANPQLIVADEPIAALDVSIQAQILNLLDKLRSDLGLTYLFISHDLRAVRYLADRVAVMYLGEIVELASADQIGRRPLMPYTRALMSAVPSLAGHAERIVLRGEIPSPANPPSGCRFRTRCPYAIDECAKTKPALREIEPGHMAACIRISPEQPGISPL